MKLSLLGYIANSILMYMVIVYWFKSLEYLSEANKYYNVLSHDKWIRNCNTIVEEVKAKYIAIKRDR